MRLLLHGHWNVCFTHFKARINYTLNYLKKEGGSAIPIHFIVVLFDNGPFLSLKWCDTCVFRFVLDKILEHLFHFGVHFWAPVIENKPWEKYVFPSFLCMKTGTFLKGPLRPCKLNSIQEIAYINFSKMTHYLQKIMD